MENPRIKLIDMGGTICSVGYTRLSEYYSSKNCTLYTIIKELPEINEIADIDMVTLSNSYSHDLTQHDWLLLHSEVSKTILDGRYSGIVITHGTNSIEETAYFLNLTANTSMPIVLTGALRPSNALSADGYKNLYNAVVMAIDKNSIGKGVLVTFNDEIHCARDVTKNSFVIAQSFISPTQGPLGYIQGEKTYYYADSCRKHTINSELIPQTAKIDLNLNKIHIIYACVDSSTIILESINAKNTLGIILAGMGKGYHSTIMMNRLIELSQQRIHIVRASHALQGIVTVDPAIDPENNFIVANNLQPAKARILLALGLAQDMPRQELQRLFYEY